MITKLSASAVEAFDPRTPFGCHRRFWFEQVQGLRAPQQPSAELGEQVHKTIEHYLATGIDGLHPIAAVGKHFIEPYLKRMVEVEKKFGPSDQVPLLAEGIPFSGRIDLIAKREPGGDPHHEILDWKTTSNIARYAKTVEGVRTSIQLATYAEWLYLQMGVNDPLRTTLVYFQTKGKAAERITTVVDRENVTARWQEICSLVREIKDVAKETDVAKIEPNYAACDVARGCYFRGRCPRADPLGVLTDKAKESTMSLLDKFRQVPQAEKTGDVTRVLTGIDYDAVTGAITPIVEVVEPKTTKPDSPQALSAADVQVPLPAATPPSKRGRPKGSKTNRSVDPDASRVAFKPCTGCEPPTVEVLGGKSITKTIVRHGLTINLGNYQSARVEVEMESPTDTAATLGTKVLEALNEQAKLYLAGQVVPFGAPEKK